MALTAVAGAARITDLRPQPGQTMLQQRDRLLTGLAAVAAAGFIAGEQLNHGGGDLLGGAPWALALEGMPVALGDAEAALQLLRQGQRLLGPGPGGGWGSCHSLAAQMPPSWRLATTAADPAGCWAALSRLRQAQERG